MKITSIFKLPFVYKLSLVFVTALLWLFVTGAPKAGALQGDSTGVLPHDPQAWLIVTRPGTNGMDARSMAGYAYVPTSAGSTFSLRIQSACDSGSEDEDPNGYNTVFSIHNNDASSIALSSGTATILSAPHGFSAVDHWVLCDAGSDVTVNVTLAGSAPTTTLNNVTYRIVRIAATVSSANNPYYANRFRFISSTAGVLFGFEDQASSPGNNNNGYTGIAYDNTGSNWGWDTTVNFAEACNAPASGTSRQVWFWDTDHIEAASSSSPYWQNANQRMTYEVRAYNRANDAFVGIAAQGNLSRGNNQTDQTASFTTYPDQKYQIWINNINYVNSIQVALPLPQINANNRCEMPPATCAVTGGAISVLPGALFSLPVRVTNPGPGTIPAGNQNTAGLHFGITTNATTNWNNSSDPIDPPPDKQSTFLPSDNGVSGVTYYAFNHTDGFNYKRFYLTSALGPGNRNVTLRATAPATAGSHTVAVRLLDRAAGDWTPNMCSVTVNVINPTPTVTIGTNNCTTLNFTVTGAAGVTYNVSLQEDDDLGGAGDFSNEPAGSGTDVGTRNITGSGSNNFSVRVQGHRDFSVHRFRVRAVMSTDSSVEGLSTSVDIGPCLEMRCASSIDVVPSQVRVGETFNITLRFSTFTIGTNTQQRIGAYGRVDGALNAYATAGSNPEIGIGSSVAPTYLRDTGTQISFASTTAGGPLIAPAAPGALTVTYRLDHTTHNGGDAPVAPATCTDSVEIIASPYFQSFRGDVIAGYGIKDNAGVCGTNASAVRAAIGLNQDATGIIGAGTQTAVIASNQVEGFRSAITQTSPANVNDQPWIRIFANANPPRNTNDPLSGIYGGMFNTVLCAENWFDDKPTTITTSSAVNYGSVTGVVQYANGSSPVRLTANGSITGIRKIFVDGDVLIGNGSDSAYVYNASGWTSVDNIPSVVIAAEGNIYIDASITRLDGIFVARGSIITCADTTVSPGSLPNPANEIPGTALYRIGGACYTNPLTLNGAFVSDSVRLWRTGGSVAQAMIGGTVQESQPLQSYAEGLTLAETFRLTPEFFLTQRPDETSLNGEPGKKYMDSLINLPPTF